MFRRLGLLVLLGVAGCSRADSDKDFDAKVHAYLVSHPGVLAEMEAAGGNAQQATGAASAPAAPPIQAHADEIFNDERDPSVGPQNAKTVLVMFADYQCPHCKAEAAPALVKLMADHPNVRFVFKEYPIFGAPSQAAAKSALAANQQGKYLPVFQALMAAPVIADAQIDQVLQGAGVDVAKAHVAAMAADTQTQINDINRLAQTLGVQGTPTFIVGDQMIAGADTAQIEHILAQAGV